MCTPCSNAALKRFFSQIRIVKTDWWNRLSEFNLTSFLRIKVAGPSLKSFHDNYCHLIINLWFNAEDRWLEQKERKKYRKRRGATKVSMREFDLPSLFETSSESELEDEFANE